MTVDEPTRAAYEAGAVDWAEQRRSDDPGPAGRLLGRLASQPVGPVADLGCGPGFHLSHLTTPAIGIDVSRSMLALAATAAPAAALLEGEIARLPLRTGSLGGAVVSKVLIHLSRGVVPEALAELHRVLAVGAPAELVVFGGADTDLEPIPDDRFAPRRFTRFTDQVIADLLEGGGFSVADHTVVDDGPWPRHQLGVVRERTLADRVAPDLRLLVCGLNPSLYAADAGVGFGRPGNRFWPAALAAGIVSVDRDPTHALTAHGVGMTDLVKRATPRADELRRDEYEAGVDRVDRLCARLRPAAVCMVGLAGWRAAVDRHAVAGWQPHLLGGRPVYVMPSTSGLNAHSSLDDLTAHLTEAAKGATG